MSFSRLYDAVQQQGDRISTKWLRQIVVELSNIQKVREVWSGVIDQTSMRGFYIEGPLGAPISLLDNECLIVLSREMCSGHLGDHWRRFVLTKELMHVFDEDTEKTDSAEKFDLQIEKFRNPSVEMSPQFRAEGKAFWRALAVLCREEKRLEYKKLIADQAVSHDVVGAALAIPPGYVRQLIRDDFEEILAGLK